MRSLLILCGGEESKQAVIIAKKMGLKVIVCDGNIRAPAKKLADDFIHASIYHPDKILTAIKKYTLKNSIDGVITVAADNPVSVSVVAKYLKLKSLSKKTAYISTNKLEMKRVLKKSKIILPFFRQIKSLDALKNAIIQRPSEYVLKPIDSRGSRGVIRLNNLSQCSKAFKYSMSYSNSNKLILEEWIPGNQLSSESIVINKKTFLCGLADRNYNRLNELYPYVVEDGGETPSKFSNRKLVKRINNLMNEVCKAINLKEGSIKGDLILSKDKLYLIEFASRLSGGSFSTFTIPEVYNYDLVKNVIKISLNEKPSLPPDPLINKKYQANRFIFIPKGKIKKISGIPKKNKKIVDFNLNVKEGDVLKKITNHTMRAGSVLTVDSTRLKAIYLAEKVIKNLKFKIE
jgi:biotin carboxylase